MAKDMRHISDKWCYEVKRIPGKSPQPPYLAHSFSDVVRMFGKERLAELKSKGKIQIGYYEWLELALPVN